MGDAGLAALAAALERGALPALRALYVQGNPASSATLEAVQAALEARARDSRVLMYVGL